MQLIRYEAACNALAECKAVDEVKTWADKAAAMQAYARMSKDKTLEVDAAEIRIRAERRLGELLTAAKSDGVLSKGAAGVGVNQHSPKEVRSSVTTAPKLSDAGISKDLSSRAQKLAAVPAAEFEAELAAKREREAKDGARVTARLEKRGAEVLAERIPDPEADSGEPSAEELAEAEAQERDDALTLAFLLESDDKLKAAAAEIYRLKAMVRLLTERNLGLINEKNEAVKAAKAWKAKFDRAERAAQ